MRERAIAHILEWGKKPAVFKLSRSQLLEAVKQASSENSTTAVFMHTIIAEQVGLGATETKTLFILSSQGALTAG